MSLSSRKKIADIAERVLWTAAQAALGVITAELLDVPVAWVPVFAMTLSAVKSWVATRLGTGSAATLPVSLERK